jgi:beta-aspartyl-peptidase (threonine type)
MNKNIAIAIHGGAGADSAYIRANTEGYENGLREALELGRKLLVEGGTAMDAVCAAVKSLEDNILFNAGRGAALNNNGVVEMDAAVMNGADLKAGAVAMVRQVKNPVGLARAVMEKTSHVLLAGYGALDFAADIGIELMDENYFISQHQLDELASSRNVSKEQLLLKPTKGTVGAVALDQYGNVAAATSTGGTSNSLPARIGDSCQIGSGCYANNSTCAVSGTGDGEILIRNVSAHSLSMLMESGNLSLQEACDLVVHERNKLTGDIGLISIDQKAGIGISFNSERMHRAWARNLEEAQVKIYP